MTLPQNRYMHKDALGSIDTITNESGVVIQRLAYDVFGKKIVIDEDKDKSLVKRGYTGHEHIEEFELIHMNGRVYDPSVGRFLSADPNIFYPYNPLDFNRYSYVWNNPLRYVDPSGYGVLSGEYRSENAGKGEEGYSNDSVGNSSNGYGKDGDGRNSENYGERYGNNGPQAKDDYKQRHEDAKKRAEIRRKAAFKIAEIERNYLNSINGETTLSLAGLLPIGVPLKVVKVIKTIKVSAKTLKRTHAIEGKRSRKKVEAISESLRTNKQVEAIKVYNHKGKDYIIDGHHRAAAGRKTNVDVEIHRTNSLGHFKSVDELLDSVNSIGFDNLKGGRR